jgi:hypothetical protein
MKAARRIAIITVFALSIALAALAQHYLVSITAGIAEVTAAQLVNAWGLARTSSSVWWVVDNGTVLVTLYNGPGAKQPLVVTIPLADPTNPKTATGSPTGAVPPSTHAVTVVEPSDGSAYTFGRLLRRLDPGDWLNAIAW